MTPTRFLIINADDFGYNDAITQGILKGYRDGLVTSTSAMVNLPGAPERVSAAHAAEPGLPVGLHLNLTAGKPVLPAHRVPHLVQADGLFYPFEEILLRFSEIPVEEVRAELHAQAECLRTAGITFDHIDYHQQVLAMYTPFFEVAAEIAQAYHVPVRQPALANVRGRARFIGPGHFGLILGFFARALLRHPFRTTQLLKQVVPTRRKAIARKLGTTDWFVGAFFGNPTLENFTAILNQLPPGLSEMMTHPAVESPELYTMPEDYRAERAQELAVLLNPHTREELNRLGIQLTSFSSTQSNNPRFLE